MPLPRPRVQETEAVLLSRTALSVHLAFSNLTPQNKANSAHRKTKTDVTSKSPGETEGEVCAVGLWEIERERETADDSAAAVISAERLTSGHRSHAPGSTGVSRQESPRRR